jgi:hypothetical protein
MVRDFGWTAAARAYAALYERIVPRHGVQPVREEPP